MFELLKGFFKLTYQLEKLDRQYALLSQELQGIYQTMLHGQAPPVYHASVDKLCKNLNQQAQVWNALRSRILSSTGSGRTLWERALAAGMDVAPFGREDMLKIRFVQILTLFPNEVRLSYCQYRDTEDIKNH